MFEDHFLLPSAHSEKLQDDTRVMCNLSMGNVTGQRQKVTFQEVSHVWMSWLVWVRVPTPAGTLYARPIAPNISLSMYAKTHCKLISQLATSKKSSGHNYFSWKTVWLIKQFFALLTSIPLRVYFCYHLPWWHMLQYQALHLKNCVSNLSICTNFPILCPDSLTDDKLISAVLVGEQVYKVYGLNQP